MKNLIFACLSILVLFSCQGEAGKAAGTETVAADSSAVSNDQALAEQLAAFYTGTLPCSDCDGVVTTLTLNADEKRTFTLEEQYNGSESRTVESTGTWTVAGDLVTLNHESGAHKYQVTAEGLVSLNADGSKRDAESAKTYLLKKVMGE